MKRLLTAILLLTLASAPLWVAAAQEPTELFNVTHEGGDLAEYDSTVTDSGDLSVESAAGLAGTDYGMQVTIDDSSPIYGQKDFSSPFTDFRARVYIDPNSSFSGVVHWFEGKNGSDKVFLLSLFNNGTDYTIRLMSYHDDGGSSGTYAFPITDAEHYVEVHITRASSNGVEDGRAALWIDGTLKEILYGIGNYSRFGGMDSVRLGAIIVGSETSGTLYLDEFKANNDGSEIGPVGSVPSPTPSPIPSPTPVPPPDTILAFPGAEGFGAESVGGRGGKVIEVTNLDDYNTKIGESPIPGSLRACIDAEGPRTCVFRVGGTITLKRGLGVTNPYLTIAGQTAPGGGIALKNSDSSEEATLVTWTHDVIIRYIRARPGGSGNVDAIAVLGAIGTITDTYNVIIDHCSASWGPDEVLSTWYGIHDVTIQWCIISEGLRGHSMGTILGSDGSYNISYHHNLLAHNSARHPRVRTAGTTDIVNNIIYNYGHQLSYIDGEYGNVLVNYVGNFVKSGPDSSHSDYFIEASSTLGDYPIEIYVQGNITPRRQTDDVPEYLVVDPEYSRSLIVDTRHDALLVTTTSAFDAYDQVLADAGANIGLDSQGNSYWRRDAVDQRIVNDVQNGTGGLIFDPSEVGGWPVLAPGTPPADTDHDGMPDEWELTHFGNLNRGSANDSSSDFDGDGYTDLEEYLNGTDPTPPYATTFIYLPLVIREATAIHDYCISW